MNLTQIHVADTFCGAFAETESLHAVNNVMDLGVGLILATRGASRGSVPRRYSANPGRGGLR